MFFDKKLNKSIISSFIPNLWIKFGNIVDYFSQLVENSCYLW
ncbi:hypothetical protein PNI0010_01591 [Streptococcus pneumoniae PNI0010]|nr:hypothetical protein PCS125219_00016 [Streptococcus pneumoniae PCS125219]ELU65571.1 hypothetical protein PNI0006_02134 [Streptococcus pneumoniae PNI0006]ELU74359.1 hypothetical protein PNI0007_00817 [Streptococcus pneumoniae PNI0007]ELU77490.1 hypothetical protein PNI0010_01591 [Streptococcus pneumoniae PNI0010]ELU90061.1 hypothetical protein PNI0360_00321 [Streptococcus pneumoniae PNI0360]